MANVSELDTAEQTPPGEGLAVGDDGRTRCAWGIHPEIYRTYHDTEWGRPVTSERAIFEKLCLEGFQAGLSWITILRKRENLWAAGGDCGRPLSATVDEVPVTTPEATALSKSLKKRGFRFVGPTTVYSTLQSLGVVNDHRSRCWAHDDCQAEQDRARGRLADSTG